MPSKKPTSRRPDPGTGPLTEQNWVLGVDGKLYPTNNRSEVNVKPDPKPTEGSEKVDKDSQS